MATLYHKVWIDAPIAKVYEELATAGGVGHWWAPHTSIETDAGLVLAHSPGEGHGDVQFLVRESVPDKLVEWEVISSHPEQSPASAWTGTHITFELSEKENPGAWRGLSDAGPKLTVLDFRHSGWGADSEYLGFCNFGWGLALAALKQLCESNS